MHFENVSHFQNWAVEFQFHTCKSPPKNISPLKKSCFTNRNSLMRVAFKIPMLAGFLSWLIDEFYDINTLKNVIIRVLSLWFPFHPKSQQFQFKFGKFSKSWFQLGPPMAKWLGPITPSHLKTQEDWLHISNGRHLRLENVQFTNKKHTMEWMHPGLARFCPSTARFDRCLVEKHHPSRPNIYHIWKVQGTHLKNQLLQCHWIHIYIYMYNYTSYIRCGQTYL